MAFADDKKRITKQSVQYSAPAGKDDHLEHFTNFFEGIRNNKPVIEDPIIGFRAAAPCLAANDRYFQKKIIDWNPEKMGWQQRKNLYVPGSIASLIICCVLTFTLTILFSNYYSSR